MRQPVKKQIAYELPNHQGYVAAIPQRASRVNGNVYQQKRSVPPQMEENFTEDDEDYADELPASRIAWRGTSARNLQKSPYAYAYPAEQIQEGSDAGKGIRRKTHRLLYLSLFVLVILVCWIGLNALSSFVQHRMNDLIYGFPRTYQTDENVEHFNSVSHFSP